MRKHATVTWFYSWRRSRSHQQSTERLHRPTQDIFFPPTTNAAQKEQKEEDRKWQTADIALDFLLCTVMFSSCMHSLICCQSFFSGPTSVHVCTYCTYIDIYMNVPYIYCIYWAFNLLFFSDVSTPHCDTTYSLCFPHYSAPYLMAHSVASKKIPHVIKCYSQSPVNSTKLLF